MADKAILIYIFFFALENRPPTVILLISGDLDFLPLFISYDNRVTLS